VVTVADFRQPERNASNKADFFPSLTRPDEVGFLPADVLPTHANELCQAGVPIHKVN
jgi:hypothetical protein